MNASGLVGTVPAGIVSLLSSFHLSLAATVTNAVCIRVFVSSRVRKVPDVDLN